MSNPPTPNYASPKPSGGMPKWLIILLVVFLFFTLGCCGLWAACNFMCSRVQSVGVAAMEAATRRAEAELLAQQARIAAEQAAIAEQAARGGAAPGVLPEPSAGAGTPAPGGSGTPAVPATGRLPSNFPSDIPVMSGMAPTFGLADVTTSSGSTILSGTAKSSDVVAYYEKELISRGWKLDTKVEFGAATTMVFSKEDRTATLSITPADNQTSTSIFYGKK